MNSYLKIIWLSGFVFGLGAGSVWADQNGAVTVPADNPVQSQQVSLLSPLSGDETRETIQNPESEQGYNAQVDAIKAAAKNLVFAKKIFLRDVVIRGK
jgi:hypothetical protein